MEKQERPLPSSLTPWTPDAMNTQTTAKPERFPISDLHRAVEIHPRHWQIDDETLARYILATRNGAKFQPPLLWKDEDDPDSRPLVIDGWHRIKAIEKVRPRGTVPCIVFTGSRREALNKAIEANSQHGLPLTLEERQNAAWKLVRERPAEGEEHAFSKARIVALAGVSKGTVDNMRKRWLVLQAERRTATGDWWRDRKDEGQPPSGDEAIEAMKELEEGMRQLMVNYHRRLSDDHKATAIWAGMGHKFGKMFVDWHLPEATLRAYEAELEEERQEQRAEQQEEQRRRVLYDEMFA